MCVCVCRCARVHVHTFYLYTHTHTHILGFPSTQFYELSRAVSQCPTKFGLGTKYPRPLQLMTKLFQHCIQTFGLPTAEENIYDSHERATGETGVAQWLRCCATNWKVAGSIPDGIIGIFH